MDNVIADVKIQALLQKVDEKKKAIKSAERPSWQTNCSFRWGGNETTNLQVTTDLEDFVKMLAFLMEKKGAWADANKELGLNVAFKFNGFTYEQWVEDIKTRINIVSVVKTKKELAVLEDKLNELMSPELKKQKALEEIEELLK